VANKTGGKKKVGLVIFILLFIVAGVPLIVAGLSFIGRVGPDSVIPDSFDLYIHAPSPVTLAERVLGHEPLSDIMALPELAPFIPALAGFENSGLLENRLVRMAAGGRLDAGFLSDGRVLAAWDLGVFSPLLRLLPLLAGQLTVPKLYYISAGKNSRFEYRMDGGEVFYIGPYRNLLVLSNNSALFESVLQGSSRDGDLRKSSAKEFYSQDYDLAFLLSPAAFSRILETGDPKIAAAVGLLQFPGALEASVRILPNQLDCKLITPLASGSPALKAIVERDSAAVTLAGIIPETAQYLTLLSAGSMREILGAASAVSGAEFDRVYSRADSTAKTFLGLSIDDILCSWTGTEFAVFGLEGRPNPVIAVEIKDEAKRKEVFDKVFTSLFVDENINLNLDGNRIPRIEVPSFLGAILEMLNVQVPAPYYTIHNNYLFISESAETLLAAVNSVRRNSVLPKTAIWRELAGNAGSPSRGSGDLNSFSLYYSLDRSLPFFLKGNSLAAAVLKLYRQGLARLSLERGIARLSLSAIPGAGKGLVPVPGFPMELGGKAGRQVYGIRSGQESRLLLVRENTALAVNPADQTISEMPNPGGNLLYIIPAKAENKPALNSGGEEGAAWVVNSQGRAALVNKNLENLRGFPVISGVRLSSPPEAFGGRLYLCGEDGFVYTVDKDASISRWESRFSSPLLSPPSFITFKNSGYAASYPKSFLGELWLQDLSGKALPNWPVFAASGIAFGSPLLFSAGSFTGSSAGTSPGNSGGSSGLLMAFITQAGELTVYDEAAAVLPPFPVNLDGVFYVQPVFDGEFLWILDEKGTLYRISLGGEVLSQAIPRLVVRQNGYISAVDVDGDEIPEIFFSGEGNALYGYKRNFMSLDGFPLPVWGRPAFGDLNGDGKIECAGTGLDNRLYMWQFKK
jgi:hypothetical protein